jgi:hypothetical protein
LVENRSGSVANVYCGLGASPWDDEVVMLYRMLTDIVDVQPSVVMYELFEMLDAGSTEDVRVEATLSYQKEGP